MSWSSLGRVHVAAACLVSVLAIDSATRPSAAAPGERAALAKLDPVLTNLHLRRASASGAPETTSVFLQTRDPAGTRRQVELLGGRVGTVAGDVLTARIPTARILDLARQPLVTRLEGALPVHPLLDKSITSMKVDGVHAGTAPLDAPYKGAGVVVGIVDEGLDLDHEAFRRDGKTRVLALWDQSLTGAAPQDFGYGVLCTQAMIDDKACPHDSKAHHGTHVAGIAAGGPISGTEVIGVAPEADIVYVHTAPKPGGADPSAAQTTAICDAAAFIFKTAEAAGKPAVVNMSLGEHTGPHDGTSLADRCLDNLTGPGKIIVAAAGNEGQGTISPIRNEHVMVHASGVASQTPTVVRFVPSVIGAGADATIAQDVFVWFDAGVDLTVRVGFEPVDGGDATFSEPVTVTQPLVPATLSDGTVTLGPVAAAGGATPSGVRGIQVRLVDQDKDMEEGRVVWLLEVTGQGRFDAFIDTTTSGGFLTTGQDPGVIVDSAMTIGFPAVASKVLAVASYVSRNAWTQGGKDHAQKNAVTDQQVEVGALSAFSSRGPTRNPEVTGLKPDIAAPGEIVAAALHGKSHPEQSERVLKPAPNGVLLAEGTSMASPAVAGTVALMLQRNKTLTVDDVRKILDATAVAPEGVAVPNPEWGRGQMDALAAVIAVTPLGGAPGGGAGGLPEAGAAPGADGGDEGCSCRATGRSAGGGLLGASAMAGLVLAGRLRRRSSRT